MLVNSGRAESLKSRGGINMGSQDLEHAQEEFEKRESAFVIVRNKEVLAESKEKGVAPFFNVVHSVNVKGASLADKIVGKAVAFLCVYAGITSVYTPVASEPAVFVLRENRIYYEADKMIPMILNRDKNDQCPIERIVSACTTPEEAYLLLRKKFEG